MPDLTELEIAYFNYEHGGLLDAQDRFYSTGHSRDFTGLVRVAGDQGRWPHILVMGEGDRYGDAGGEGMYGAAAAMRAAGGPAYVPLLGSLPREWGPHAPVIFVDAQSVVIRRWHDPRQPDFAARFRNLLIASLPGRSECFRIVATHGDLHDGDARLADAKAFRRFANPDAGCLIAGDWNSVPSGPLWADPDLASPQRCAQTETWRVMNRAYWQHGPGQGGPYRPDTRALDYLIGYWEAERGERIGGIGFYDAADLARDNTPTQPPTPAGGWQRRTIDRILVNQLWKDAIVPGSYHVHQPADPSHPDSDHLRVSITVRI
jgi:endonuclease/exonuclease/phosphatase family metal-dependent hydrolase